MTNKEIEDIVEESHQLEEGDGKDLQHVQDEYIDDGTDENTINSDIGIFSDSGNDRKPPHFSSNDNTQSHT